MTRWRVCWRVISTSTSRAIRPIVVQNQPAAGSLVTTNQIYRQYAPKDGTVIALIQRGMLTPQADQSASDAFRGGQAQLARQHGERGRRGLRLVYGSSTRPRRICSSKELIVGGHAGVDPEMTPRLYNAVLGTKFKIILGYNGTADIGLAIERGEVQGIGDWSWSSLKKQKPDWIRDKKITVLLQSGLKNSAGPSGRAECDRLRQDRVRPQGARTVLHAEDGGAAGHRPAGNSGRADCDPAHGIRGAGQDREFLADAERSNLDVDPMSGEEVDKIVGLITAAPPDVVDRYIKAFAGTSAPP